MCERAAGYRLSCYSALLSAAAAADYKFFINPYEVITSVMIMHGGPGGKAAPGGRSNPHIAVCMQCHCVTQFLQVLKE